MVLLPDSVPNLERYSEIAFAPSGIESERGTNVEKRVKAWGADGGMAFF
jgi:hypothetical protein